MFRGRLRARLCRGKEGLHRAPTFVRQFGGYTHILLLLFLSSTHYCPLFHLLLSEISSSSCKDLARGSAGSKTPGVVTICGWSAAGRRPTPGLQQQLQGSCARVRRIQNARRRNYLRMVCGGAQTHTMLLLLLFLTFSALVANPKKTTLHGGQSRSWSAEQGKKEKEKVWQRIPPPPPPRAARSEKINKHSK